MRDVDRECAESADVARSRWEAGLAPSEILRELLRLGHRNPIELIMIGAAAFGLGLAEMKGSNEVDWKTWEPLPTFDAYFLPLIVTKHPR